MWLTIFLIPMAWLIGACLNALPKKFQMAPSRTGWLLLLPGVIAFIAYCLPKNTEVYTLMVLMTALLCYYLVRGLAIVGLVVSYQEFGRNKHPLISTPAIVLGWTVSILEPLAIFLLFLLSFMFDFPATMDRRGVVEIMFYLTLFLAIGMALSFLFLMNIYALRKKISTTPIKIANTIKAPHESIFHVKGPPPSSNSSKHGPGPNR